MQDIIRLYLSMDEAKLGSYSGRTYSYWISVVSFLAFVGMAFYFTLFLSDAEPLPRFWLLAMFGTYAPGALSHISTGLMFGAFGERLRRYGQKVWMASRISSVLIGWPSLLLLSYYFALLIEESVLVVMLFVGGVVAISLGFEVRSLLRRKRELQEESDNRV